MQTKEVNGVFQRGSQGNFGEGKVECGVLMEEKEKKANRDRETDC